MGGKLGMITAVSCFMVVFNTADASAVVDLREESGMSRDTTNKQTELSPLQDVLLEQRYLEPTVFHEYHPDNPSSRIGSDNNRAVNLPKYPIRLEGFFRRTLTTTDLGVGTLTPRRNDHRSRFVQEAIESHQTIDKQEVTSRIWVQSSLTNEIPKQQNHPNVSPHTQHTYTSPNSLLGSTGVIKWIQDDDVIDLKARTLWIGVLVGSAISFTALAVVAVAYNLSGRCRRRNRCMGMPGFNLCTLGRETIKEPVYIRLSQLHHPRAGSHYVVSVLDETGNANNNSGWSSEEEEIFNISDIKQNTPFLSTSAPPHVNWTSTPLKPQVKKNVSRD
ncbi:hypothetical protein ScPMuIL_010346 [Solemya velum]